MSFCRHAVPHCSQGVNAVRTWLHCTGAADPVADHSEQQASHLSGQRLAQHLPTPVDDSYTGVIAAALNAQDKLVSGGCRKSALLKTSTDHHSCSLQDACSPAQQHLKSLLL